jgi:hypothetical protein
MFGRDELMGALMGAVVLGSVIGVTSSVMRRRGQSRIGQPAFQPAGPVRLPTPRVNRLPRQAGPTPGSDLVNQLERLGKLHAAGELTDEEFALAKQKLLAG